MNANREERIKFLQSFCGIFRGGEYIFSPQGLTIGDKINHPLNVIRLRIM
jgi:hypothetical protein